MISLAELDACEFVTEIIHCNVGGLEGLLHSIHPFPLPPFLVYLCGIEATQCPLQSHHQPTHTKP